MTRPANAADREAIDELLDNPATDTTTTATTADAATAADADAAATITASTSTTTRNRHRYEVHGDSVYADGATLAKQTGRGHA